jgi:ferredoxin
MGSIDQSDPFNVPGICIKCQACVRKCPMRARFFDDPDFLSHVRMLERSFTERKEIIFWEYSNLPRKRQKAPASKQL